MEEYIDSIIRVGKILIGSIMVVFVLWYIVKDIIKDYGKDSHERCVRYARTYKSRLKAACL